MGRRLLAALLTVLLTAGLVMAFLLVSNRTDLLQRLPGWPKPAPTATPVLAGTVERSPAGAYWGAYLPRADVDRSVVSTFVTDVGRAPAIVSVYQQWWGEPAFPAAAALRLERQGTVPMLVWEPWQPGLTGDQVSEQPAYRLSKIAGGAFDGYVRRYADQVRAYGGPVLLEPMHEMNGHWYPWGGTVNGNTTTDYVAAWRHLHDVFQQEGATNVTWTWTVNRDTLPNTAANQPERYWPGAAYVDWVGLDAYNWGAHPGSQWWSVPVTFGASLTALSRYGKPIIIAETACTEQGGDKAAWIESLFTMVTGASRDAVGAVVWFDAPAGNYDWRTNTSAASQAAFEAGVARPGILSAGQIVLSTVPR